MLCKNQSCDSPCHHPLILMSRPSTLRPPQLLRLCSDMACERLAWSLLLLCAGIAHALCHGVCRLDCRHARSRHRSRWLNTHRVVRFTSLASGPYGALRSLRQGGSSAFSPPGPKPACRPKPDNDFATTQWLRCFRQVQTLQPPPPSLAWYRAFGRQSTLWDTAPSPSCAQWPNSSPSAWPSLCCPRL